MPINKKYQAPFESGKYYHVYNRAHSKLQLFQANQDYNRFLFKTEHYLSEYVDFFSYNLIPNHFHFFLQVKEIDEIVKKFEFDTVDEFLTEALRSLFISHTGWMNIKYDRHGGLFSSPFKDIEVVDEEYMKRMVLYTNWNHVHHGITNKLEDYPYSSYQDFLHNLPTIINKEKVFQLFGGKENFFKEHQAQLSHYTDFKFSIE